MASASHAFRGPAWWRSGDAEDCKSLHPGSIPGQASNRPPRGSDDRRLRHRSDQHGREPGAHQRRHRPAGAGRHARHAARAAVRTEDGLGVRRGLGRIRARLAAGRAAHHRQAAAGARAASGRTGARDRRALRRPVAGAGGLRGDRRPASRTAARRGRARPRRGRGDGGGRGPGGRRQPRALRRDRLRGRGRARAGVVDRRAGHGGRLGVVERSGPGGRARLYLRSQDGALARRDIFDAVPEIMPGFGPKPAFAL